MTRHGLPFPRGADPAFPATRQLALSTPTAPPTSATPQEPRRPQHWTLPPVATVEAASPLLACLSVSPVVAPETKTP